MLKKILVTNVMGGPLIRKMRSLNKMRPETTGVLFLIFTELNCFALQFKKIKYS